MAGAVINTNENRNSAASPIAAAAASPVVAAVAAGTSSPRLPRTRVGDSHGGTHSLRGRAHVAAQSEAPSAGIPPPLAESTGGVGGDGSYVGEGGGNGRKPAWNKPSINGSNVESVVVIGAAESWPTPTEATKGGLRLNSSDSSDSYKGPPDLSVPLSTPVNVNQPSTVESPSSSSHKSVAGYANPNPNESHGWPARQKSMKREGGGGGSFNGGVSNPVSPHGSFEGGSSSNNNLGKSGSSGGVDGAGRGREPGHGDASRESGGQRSSGDHSQQRGSYRRGNGGQHNRGESSHPNYGGRHDQDRGNPDWNHQRNFNGYSPRPFGRGNMMRPAPPVHAPVMPAVPFPRPLVGPIVPPDYQPVLYLPPPQALSPFGIPMPSMYYPPQDPFPPQDYSLPQDAPLPVNIAYQIHYYFSDENLVKDTFLRGKMDQQGWVPISLIAGFKKMRGLTDNIQLILESVKGSRVVEVQGDRIRRRDDWGKWILLPAGELPATSGPESPGISGNDILAAQFQSFGLDERTASMNTSRGLSLDSNYYLQASVAGAVPGGI
ncbi:La-related protein [Drosera capensis]